MFGTAWAWTDANSIGIFLSGDSRRYVIRWETAVVMWS